MPITMFLPNIPLAWMVVPSPIGNLTLVASNRGLVRVGFEVDKLDLLLAGVDPSKDSEIERILNQARAELADYFSGTRREFTVPLDSGIPEGFRSRASHELEQVPFGVRVTYGELARRAGNQKAARAVGSMCANNPLPIFIPCHRVVRSDQTTGEYRGGNPAKDYLLAMEEELREI